MICYRPTSVIETTIGEFTDELTGEYWPNKKQIKIIQTEKPLETAA